MSFTRTLLYGAVLSVSGAAAAGELNISQEALGVVEGAEPNVVIIIDDSGSMDWEAMTRDFDVGRNLLVTGTERDGTNTAGNALKNRDSDDDGVADCTINDGSFKGYLYGVEFGSNTYTDDGNDCNTADDQEWRFRNSDFNTLYFDPRKDYEPWVGVDATGSKFADADITNAPDDPYSPKEYINLTIDNSNWGGGTSRATSDRDGDGNPDGFRFYTWADKDGDGAFDDGEETEYKIGHITQAQIDAAGWTNPDGTNKTVAQLKQDFANWFTYWRSREHVARGALGASVAGMTNMRIGFTTINSNLNNFEVRSMNPLVNSGNKRDLLDKIYATPTPAAGTPLRSALLDVGRYFECASGNKFNSGGVPGSEACPVQAAPLGQCQQNSAILMTDGFYNGSSPSLGNTDGSSNSEFDGYAFGDDYSDTLADIAMHYYERDLHSSLLNRVPATKRDEVLSRRLNGEPTIEERDPLHQHMSTYTISFGVEGTMSWLDAPPTVWPDPALSNAAKIDDLMHAAYNGRGQYFSASDPQALADSLREALAAIAGGVGIDARFAFSSGSVQTDTNIFAATYDTVNQRGELAAHRIDCRTISGNKVCRVEPDSTWKVAQQLSSRLPGSRNIVTYDPTNLTGIPFQFATLTDQQKSDLEMSPLPATLPASYNSSLIDERVEFIRGDRSNEGDNGDGFDAWEFRERASLLGDIVNSSPVYVGVPDPDRLRKKDRAPYPQANLYSAFAAQPSVTERMPIVYVGANDGMLHAFNAKTGHEEFGYIPSFVIPNLYKLTEHDYDHRMFVDGSPTVTNAYVNNNWKTVLVGGVGAGGRGYYALDITEPDSTSGFGDEASVASRVMWEFTNAHDSDLGFSFSEPVIGMTNASGGGGEKQWVVMFGNGYNSTSADGDAALFILKIEGPLSGDWTGDYIKISTGVGKAESADGATPNGLGGLRAADEDKNGTIDYVYAGDLQGNLFRFDLAGSNFSNWSNSNNVDRIFHATDASGNAQPITIRPVVMDNPHGGLNVMFGTGSWMTVDDATSLDDHTIYSVWDDFSNNRFVSRANGDLFEQRFSDHKQASIDNEGQVVEASSGPITLAHGTSNAIVDWSIYDGWFMDLQPPPSADPSAPAPPYPGERAIGRYKLETRNPGTQREEIVLTTNTVIPRNPNSCDPAPRGFRIALDALNGGRPEEAYFDVNKDGGFTTLDDVKDQAHGVVIKIRADDNTTCIGSHCFSGVEFEAMKEDREDGSRTGRLSWQEIR